MTYLEYMENHPDENLDWCRPYVSKDGEYALLKHDREPEIARTPAGDLYRYNGSLSGEALEQIARAVNPDYDVFNGWTDEQIAIIAMHETGCAACPWRHECEAMGAEMETPDLTGII